MSLEEQCDSACLQREMTVMDSNPAQSLHSSMPVDWADVDSDIDDGAPNGVNLRAAPRFTLLLRSAKLVADGREFICVLRDVSDTGLKLRLFHPLPDADVLELELPEGTRLPLEPIWHRDSHAGFRFKERIDARVMIEHFDGPYPRRPVRVQVHNNARVTAHGDVRDVRILNLSQQGACIECDEHLMLREKICIEGDLLPPITAHVCWREAPRYGLAFEQGFHLDELARCLARMQQLPDDE